MKFSDTEHRDERWVKNWIMRSLTSFEENGYGYFAVVELATGNVMGYCGLHDEIIAGRHEVSLGYRLFGEHWHRGYATEASKALLDWAQGHRKISRVVATIDPLNLASLSVAKKLGMVYELDVMHPDYTHPDWLYVLVGNED